MTNTRAPGKIGCGEKCSLKCKTQSGSTFTCLPPSSPMGPSVRVKRRHVYSSIQDDDRLHSEQLPDDQLAVGRRTLSEPGAALSPASASGSLPSVPPLDPSYLSPSLSFPRRDLSRVNRLARRSVSYRSFATDLDSNPADSPPATYGRSQDVPLRESIPEGTSTDPAVPHPHHAHPQRVSRVRSAISSSPSGSHRDSDSDSDSDDEDTMEDNEYHHDDHVVDHLDVIGPPPSHVLPSISFLTRLLHRPPGCHSRDSYKHGERYSSVINSFFTTSMFQLTLPQATPLVLQSQASRYPSAWARTRR